MARSNNRERRSQSGQHVDTAVGYAARRVTASTPFRDRVEAAREVLKIHDAVPRVEDVVLVLPGQRAPRRGDYIYYRPPSKDRLTGYWYARMRPARSAKGERWSTACTFEEQAQARQVYVDHRVDIAKEKTDEVDPAGRPVPEILDGYVEHMSGRYHDSHAISSGRLENVMAAVARLALAPFVHEMNVGDVTRAFTPKYMAWAKCQMPAGGGYAHNTAAGSVVALREALETILSDCWRPYKAPFEIPKPDFTAIEVFNPDEIERIPIAAETGRQWDVLADDWVRVLDETTGQKVCVLRRTEQARASIPYGRLFQLNLWFGNRVKVSLNAEWRNNGGPWIDLDRAIMHRLGSKQEETAKRRGYCKIPESVLPILRAWRDEDEAHGCTHVVHTWDYRPLKEVDYGRWYSLMEAAGARPLSTHACKHTCAQILKLRGVPLEQASMYLVTTIDTLVKRYGADWDVEMTRAAADAISGAMEAAPSDLKDLAEVARVAGPKPANQNSPVAVIAA